MKRFIICLFIAAGMIYVSACADQPDPSTANQTRVNNPFAIPETTRQQTVSSNVPNGTRPPRSTIDPRFAYDPQKKFGADARPEIPQEPWIYDGSPYLLNVHFSNDGDPMCASIFVVANGFPVLSQLDDQPETFLHIKEVEPNQTFALPLTFHPVNLKRGDTADITLNFILGPDIISYQDTQSRTEGGMRGGQRISPAMAFKMQTTADSPILETTDDGVQVQIIEPISPQKQINFDKNDGHWAYTIWRHHPSGQLAGEAVMDLPDEEIVSLIYTVTGGWGNQFRAFLMLDHMPWMKGDQIRTQLFTGEEGKSTQITFSIARNELAEYDNVYLFVVPAEPTEPDAVSFPFIQKSWTLIIRR